MWGKPVVAEASVTLQQPEVCHVFSWGSCPWITGPWQWRAAQAPGRGGVDSDLACTQASWWQQQQPQRLMPVSGVRPFGSGSRPSLELF